MNECIIGIGSNMNAEENIRKALDKIATDFQILDISEMVTTKAIGIEDQPDFMNGAVKICTRMEQKELCQYLKMLEDQLGRDRSLPKFGPRNIDLDIVIWNSRVVDEDYYTRDFLKTACTQLGFVLNEHEL